MAQELRDSGSANGQAPPVSSRMAAVLVDTSGVLGSRSQLRVTGDARLANIAGVSAPRTSVISYRVDISGGIS
jgi:hypothetical protein